MNNLDSGVQVRVNIKNQPDLVCECGNTLFAQVFFLKKISKVYTGSGRDELLPIPVFCCSACGKILPESDFRKDETPSTSNNSSIITGV